MSTGEQLIIGQLAGPYAGVSTGGSPFSGPGGFLYAATNSNLVNLNMGLPSSGSFTFGFPGAFIGLAVDGASNTTSRTQFSGTYNAASRSVTFRGMADFTNIAGFGAASFNFGGSGTIPGSSDSLKNASLGWSCTGAGCQSSAGSGTWDSRFAHSSTSIPAQVLNGGLVNGTRNGASGNTVIFTGGLKCVSGGC